MIRMWKSKNQESVIQSNYPADSNEGQSETVGLADIRRRIQPNLKDDRGFSALSHLVIFAKDISWTRPPFSLLGDSEE